MVYKRVDKNQKKIVRALRDAGVTVMHTHEVGKGAPDIVAGHRGVNYLFEIKSKGGRLTDNQVEFHSKWRGQVAVVYSAEDCLEIIFKNKQASKLKSKVIDD